MANEGTQDAEKRIEWSTILSAFGASWANKTTTYAEKEAIVKRIERALATAHADAIRASASIVGYHRWTYGGGTGYVGTQDTQGGAVHDEPNCQYCRILALLPADAARSAKVRELEARCDEADWWAWRIAILNAKLLQDGREGSGEVVARVAKECMDRMSKIRAQTQDTGAKGESQ